MPNQPWRMRGSGLLAAGLLFSGALISNAAAGDCPAPPVPPIVLAPARVSCPYDTQGSPCNVGGSCMVSTPFPDPETEKAISYCVFPYLARGGHLPAGSTMTVCNLSGCTTYTLSTNGKWAHGSYVPTETHGDPPSPPPSPRRDRNADGS